MNIETLLSSHSSESDTPLDIAGNESLLSTNTKRRKLVRRVSFKGVDKRNASHMSKISKRKNSLANNRKKSMATRIITQFLEQRNSLEKTTSSETSTETSENRSSSEGSNSDEKSGKRAKIRKRRKRNERRHDDDVIKFHKDMTPSVIQVADRLVKAKQNRQRKKTKDEMAEILERVKLALFYNGDDVEGPIDQYDPAAADEIRQKMIDFDKEREKEKRKSREKVKNFITASLKKSKDKTEIIAELSRWFEQSKQGGGCGDAELARQKVRESRIDSVHDVIIALLSNFLTKSNKLKQIAEQLTTEFQARKNSAEKRKEDEEQTNWGSIEKKLIQTKDLNIMKNWKLAVQKVLLHLNKAEKASQQSNVRKGLQTVTKQFKMLGAAIKTKAIEVSEMEETLEERGKDLENALKDGETLQNTVQIYVNDIQRLEDEKEVLNNKLKDVEEKLQNEINERSLTATSASLSPASSIIAHEVKDINKLKVAIEKSLDKVDQRKEAKGYDNLNENQYGNTNGYFVRQKGRSAVEQRFQGHMNLRTEMTAREGRMSGKSTPIILEKYDSKRENDSVTIEALKTTTESLKSELLVSQQQMEDQKLRILQSEIETKEKQLLQGQIIELETKKRELENELRTATDTHKKELQDSHDKHKISCEYIEELKNTVSKNENLIRNLRICLEGTTSNLQKTKSEQQSRTQNEDLTQNLQIFRESQASNQQKAKSEQQPRKQYEDLTQNLQIFRESQASNLQKTKSEQLPRKQNEDQTQDLHTNCEIKTFNLQKTKSEQPRIQDEDQNQSLQMCRENKPSKPQNTTSEEQPRIQNEDETQSLQICNESKASYLQKTKSVEQPRAQHEDQTQNLQTCCEGKGSNVEKTKSEEQSRTKNKHQTQYLQIYHEGKGSNLQKAKSELHSWTKNEDQTQHHQIFCEGKGSNLQKTPSEQQPWTQNEDKMQSIKEHVERITPALQKKLGEKHQWAQKQLKGKKIEMERKVIENKTFATMRNNYENELQRQRNFLAKEHQRYLAENRKNQTQYQNNVQLIYKGSIQLLTAVNRFKNSVIIILEKELLKEAAEEVRQLDCLKVEDSFTSNMDTKEMLFMVTDHVTKMLVSLEGKLEKAMLNRRLQVKAATTAKQLAINALDRQQEKLRKAQESAAITGEKLKKTENEKSHVSKSYKALLCDYKLLQKDFETYKKTMKVHLTMRKEAGRAHQSNRKESITECYVKECEIDRYDAQLDIVAAAQRDGEVSSYTAQLETAVATQQDREVDNNVVQLETAVATQQNVEADSNVAQLETAVAVQQDREADSNVVQLETAVATQQNVEADSNVAQLETAVATQQDREVDSNVVQLETAIAAKKDGETDSHAAKLETAVAAKKDGEADSNVVQLETAVTTQQNVEADSNVAQLETAVATQQDRETDSNVVQLETAIVAKKDGEADSHAAKLETAVAAKKDGEADSHAVKLETAVAAKKDGEADSYAVQLETEVAAKKDGKADSHAAKLETAVAAKKDGKADSHAAKLETAVAAKKDGKADSHAAKLETAVAAKKDGKADSHAAKLETAVAAKKDGKADSHAAKLETEVAAKKDGEADSYAEKLETAVAAKKDEEADNYAEQLDTAVAAQKDGEEERYAAQLELKVAAKKDGEAEYDAKLEIVAAAQKDGETGRYSIQNSSYMTVKMRKQNSNQMKKDKPEIRKEYAVHSSQTKQMENLRRLDEAFQKDEVTPQMYEKVTDLIRKTMGIPRIRFVHLVKRYLDYNRMVNMKEALKDRFARHKNKLKSTWYVRERVNKNSRKWEEKRAEFIKHRSAILMQLTKAFSTLEQETGLQLVEPTWHCKINQRPPKNEHVKLRQLDKKPPVGQMGVSILGTGIRGSIPEPPIDMWEQVHIGKGARKETIIMPKIVDLDINRWKYSSVSLIVRDVNVTRDHDVLRAKMKKIEVAYASKLKLPPIASIYPEESNESKRLYKRRKR